ncbi:MAG: hypothetical protein IPL96_02445 [Holophagaceae bacterium]|nr:hypothetical protein [Holophagaceae bacterium]
MNRTWSFLTVLLAASVLRAGDTPLPLPDAPVRVVIPDAAAFDAALQGSYRAFLTGGASNEDRAVAAFRKTQVGSKLEDQWGRLSADLPWTWEEIRKLKPTAVGLALLEAGHLEAVLVIETPLAQLPVTLPGGTKKTHGGAAYSLVAPGAGDKSKDPDRRAGFAWARVGGRLFLATSERALMLALDEQQAGRGLAAPLPGLISMELNLDALRQDRYFQREFLWPAGPETGRLRAALREEGGHLVEVREGVTEPRGGVFTFAFPGAAAAGWESDGAGFWPAFRRALLEPIPVLLDKPVPALSSLPATAAQGGEDRYLVNFTRPRVAPGAPAFEEGDLAAWKALLARQAIPSWGFLVTKDGVRRMAFPWPEALDAEFLELCRATVARRGGRATVVKTAEGMEIRVGPALPALALRRAGGLLWVAPSAQDLKDAPQPQADAALVRWGRVDLAAAHAEARRWAKVEGPANPETVRPLSDRILGLLGWMPKTTGLSVERRKTDTGWRERVVFESEGK